MKFTYLSLGAGVQSSALLAMSVLGLRDCPKADVAIFADTLDEPSWVYEQLAVLRAWATPRGCPVVTVGRGGKLSDDRRVQIPAFVIGKDGDPGPLSRNCTRDYKISPVRKEARRLMEMSGYTDAECLFGISVDEWQRMKISPVKWIQNVYPLITARMTRSACAKLLEEIGLPVPRKSACVYCPFHSDRSWREIRDHDTDGWALAVAYDDKIRAERGASLHRSLIPLREIDFGEDHPELFDTECSGHCGV